MPDLIFETLSNLGNIINDNAAKPLLVNEISATTSTFFGQSNDSSYSKANHVEHRIYSNNVAQVLFVFPFL